MDEQLTLHEIQRLEAERKLRTIPRLILESAWVRDAQVEAVIDAVLAVAVGDNVAALAHARHVGEWCARIATALPFGPDAALARRVGVLADVDPAALERIDELKHVAPYIREYQSAVMGTDDSHRTMSSIVAVADEFDSRISTPDGSCFGNAAFRSMLASAEGRNVPIVEALGKALDDAGRSRVA